ncbi:MAG: hypothetical protein EBR82_80380 [Caulobacteraceae bacterium]|nr:hypothetical protein [Caulobacteraceae bacterium]
METVVWYVGFCIAAMPAILLSNRYSDDEIFEVLFFLIVMVTLPVNGIIWLCIYGWGQGWLRRNEAKAAIERKILKAN